MSAWITGRVPTREDGDTSGMVWTTEDGVVARSYTNSVRLGTPWQPITYPEPYVKPRVWTLRQNASCIFYLAKNGNHVIGLSPFSLDEMKAMTDALNKLEEGV